MNFNRHYELEGKHAPFGGSKYHWINYSEEKAADVYRNMLAVQRGTALHDLAAKCIGLKQKLPRSEKSLNSYVNDAIGYRMTPEVGLYYSEKFFGRADALSFEKDILRIHDYKSGLIPAKMDQLNVYAAFFCLEYKIKPGNIGMELRIYQNNDILVSNPTAEDILPIINKIITFDKIFKRIDQEEN